MSRYIDADALIADLDKGLWGKDYDKALAEAIIQDAPSIDIVLCKDCKYEDNCEQMVLLSSMCGEVEDIRAIDFCSYGQKGDENVETD